MDDGELGMAADISCRKTEMGVSRVRTSPWEELGNCGSRDLWNAATIVDEELKKDAALLEKGGR